MREYFIYVAHDEPTTVTGIVLTETEITFTGISIPRIFVIAERKEICVNPNVPIIVQIIGFV